MDAVRTLDRLRGKRREIFEILEAYGASNPRIVGSVARGEDDAESDIDLMLDMPDELSLLDVIGIELKLGELVGGKFQIVEEGGVPDKVYQSMLADAVGL